MRCITTAIKVDDVSPTGYIRAAIKVTVEHYVVYRLSASITTLLSSQGHDQIVTTPLKVTISDLLLPP
jgi:hypothetical protein